MLATNSPTPTGLYTQGSLVPVSVALPQILQRVMAGQGHAIPGPQAVTALIDTGAQGCCIDHSVAAALGLQPTRTIQIGSAAGQNPHPVYVVNLALLVNPAVSFDPWEVIGVDVRGNGIGALLGRDALARSLFVYNGVLGSWTLAI